MLYVDIATLKAHLRIDPDDTSEDALLSQYIETAQEDAETRMRRPIYSEDPEANPVTADLTSIPAQIKQFILVTAGDLYRNRENRQEKAYTTYFDHLLDQWIDYDG
jgi:hypothetical protein